MGPLIVADLMLLVFSIYVGIFFKYFHTDYPEMKIGFHIREVCYNRKTWYYGNNFAGNLAIILGVLFFAIIFPILIYLDLPRNYLSIIIVLCALLYFLLLFIIVKIRVRRKFKLKDQ